jgi:hypothetical protein
MPRQRRSGASELSVAGAIPRSSRPENWSAAGPSALARVSSSRLATSPDRGLWGLGPTAVVVKTTEHIVAGLLVNQLRSACWSTSSGRPAASIQVRAGSVMRRSLQSPSSTRISAAVGSSASPDHHRRRNPRRPEMDGTPWRCRGPNHQARGQTAGQIVVRRLLQCRDPKYGARWQLQSVSP